MHTLNTIIIILNLIIFLIWFFRFRNPRQTVENNLFISVILLLSGSGIAVGIPIIYILDKYQLEIFGCSFSYKKAISPFLD